MTSIYEKVAAAKVGYRTLDLQIDSLKGRQENSLQKKSTHSLFLCKEITPGLYNLAHIFLIGL